MSTLTRCPDASKMERRKNCKFQFVAALTYAILGAGALLNYCAIATGNRTILICCVLQHPRNDILNRKSAAHDEAVNEVILFTALLSVFQILIHRIIHINEFGYHVQAIRSFSSFDGP